MNCQRHFVSEICQYHVGTWRRDTSMAETVPQLRRARALVVDYLVANRRTYQDNESGNNRPSLLDTAPLFQF